VLLLALAFSLVAFLVEFTGNPNLHKVPYSRQGLARLGVYCLVFLALALLRVRRLRFPGPWAYFTALALAYGVAVAGVQPIAATILCWLSAIAVGSLVLGDSWKHRTGELVLCFILGEGLLGFAAALMGRTYFCYPAVFLVLLLIPVVLRRRWLTERFHQAWHKFWTADQSWPGAIAAALLALVAGIQFVLVLKPEVGADALAMHLALPAYVSIHHHWPYDVREFIWAVMPQTTDWAYTLAYSLGGEFAARLLNFANFAAILGLLYGFARQYCSHLAALSVCTLFATTPLVEMITGSLFIDNFLAALLFASFAAFCFHFVDSPPPPDSSLFTAGWLALGLALSTKSGSLAFLPGLIALSIYAARRRPVGWKVWSLSAAGALGIGAYFYAAAWLSTGNPVFPYANEIFRSKWIDAVPIASQYRRGLTWRTPFEITFHSSGYLESSDGAAGFQYFLLLPAAFVAMFWRRHPFVLWAAVVGLSAFCLEFSQLSYLRYAYPALLVLMAPIALWLDQQDRAPAAMRWFAYGVVALAGVMNLLFQSAAGDHRDFVWNQLWDRAGNQRYLESHAPARLIVQELNRIAPGEPALFCQDDVVAQFAGPAYTTTWHTYLRNDGLKDLREVVDLLSFANQRKIRYFVSPPPGSLDTWPRVIPAFLQDFTEPVFVAGDWHLFRLKPEFQGASGTEAATRLAAQPPPADPGTYDDADIRVIRKGSWFRDFSMAAAMDHTLTDSRTAGDSLTFTFRAASIAYEFARGPTLGIAEVQIDGESVAEIDEFAGTAVFGQSRVLGGLTPGVHTLTVQVTGRKNAASQDQLVVLDGIRVQ
jgi:4-amino-4-deoxy-L-arabinose transferase-like glycosyltransferase